MAFQYAADNWASVIKSQVRIIIGSDFIDFEEGVLGQAGSTSFSRDFSGAPLNNTFTLLH